jgi:hypothetical protein
MSRTVPWHSGTERIYHDNSDCSFGRGLTGRHRIEGSGGKRLCAECAKLDRAEESLHHVQWWDVRRAIGE